mmetsp:Transcript_67455/g.150550  ORF Transcript_67455/g.150550 Transcript_67455/m.150550 type:complete len:96 (-) Transcript_67455:392-679(-)
MTFLFALLFWLPPVPVCVRQRVGCIGNHESTGGAVRPSTQLQCSTAKTRAAAHAAAHVQLLTCPLISVQQSEVPPQSAAPPPSPVAAHSGPAWCA